MSIKRAFLSLGPESSGTRLMAGLLIAAGCYGDDGHIQRLDVPGAPVTCNEPLIVWRRSVPHGNDHEWPNLGALANSLYAAGYEVTAVVMSRDWHAMAISQQNSHTGGDVELALNNIRDSYPFIFAHLAAAGVPYELVNYEAITQRPIGTIRYLMQRLGLSVVDPSYIYDGNAKYYHEVECDVTKHPYKLYA